jgi:hypothetical protein
VLNDAGVTYPARLPPPVAMYGLEGWVLNRYPSTYPKFLIQKAYAAVGGAKARPPGPLTEAAEEEEAWTPEARDTAVYARVSRAYVRARADDILGDRDEARAEYLAIAADPAATRDARAALLQSAAREFAQH